MKSWARCWLVLALSVHCGVQASEVWTGWVSWVVDGDTVLLMRQGEQEPVKLRIDGIDAPEICQVGGLQSRDAMVRLALRKSVEVDDRGQDIYGRQVGRLSADGVDLGAEMVRSGMAWAYRFQTGKGPYAGLQQQAEKQKKGVFASDDEPISPPDFRKRHGACQGN